VPRAAKPTKAAKPTTPGPQDDVVDLLLAQHAQIEELFLLVAGGTGDARRDAFDDLVSMLAVHETAEEELIHPLVRTLPGAGGEDLVGDRLEEERQAKEMLNTLIDGGVDADGFDTAILLLRDAVLQHARHEERYEFTRLRQHIAADRLRGLADAFLEVESAAGEPSTPDGGSDPLDDATRDELYEMAKEADIHGRSSMNKRELADAIREEA